jgi:hypothetical protein
VGTLAVCPGSIASADGACQLRTAVRQHRDSAGESLRCLNVSDVLDCPPRSGGNVMGDAVELNAREISSLLWLGLFVAWALSVKSVRKSLGPVFRSLATPTIAIPLVLMIGYVCLSVFILHSLGVWTRSDAKDTILWLLGFALITFFETSAVSRDPSRFKTIVVELFGMAVVLEFVLNFFVMPLWSELLLVPFLTLLGMLLVFAERRHEYGRLVRPLKAVSTIVGFGILAFAVFQMATRFGEFWNLATLRQFILPLALSLLFLLFIYSMSVYIAYDTVLRLLQWRVSDNRVRSYARRRTFVLCKAKLSSLAAWARVVNRARFADMESVDAAVAAFRASRNGVGAC